MMAMAALMHELNTRVQAIKNTDPKTLVDSGRGKTVVERVLSGETTFAKEVRRGIVTLESKQKEPPHYFDLTPEYGELVALLGGDCGWCCNNSKSTPRPDGITNVALVLIFVLSQLLWYESIREGIWEVAGATFVFAWLPFLLYKLDKAMNGSSPVEQSFGAFFRWAPIFWDVMEKKAEEVDEYICHHPEVRRSDK
jgi:hypothetical protein